MHSGRRAQRFVVEQVSAIANVPRSSGQVPSVSVHAALSDVQVNDMYIPMTAAGHDITADVFMATQLARLYGQNGGLMITLQRGLGSNDAASGSMGGSVSLSGYLIDIP